MSGRGWARWVASAALVAAVGCGGGVRRFPLANPLWVDDDMRPFSPEPEGFYSSYSWDGADNAVFRPVSDFLAVKPSRVALNVNALDEVPDSSWFVNRLSRRLMTPEEIARGSCEDFDEEPPGPWTIVGGKPDGASPGFQIEDANGVRYLFKPDGTLQQERPSAADTLGAMIFHAAGYHVPCNRVVLFDRSILVLGEGTTIKRTNGSEEPLTEHHVEQVLSKATRLPDGRYRVGLSRFIDGRPISPWRYHGTTDGDLNDVVPHEHRRDVRGMYVLSAWTSHIDSRQENTMAAWVAREGSETGYVRHYMIDFSDCFGITHAWDDLVKRFGHSGYLDFGDIVVDFVSLGLVDRPWYHSHYGAAGPTLGYYDAERFVADEWKPGYRNDAYDELTEPDAAWMTRIVSRFRDEHIHALVERGQFSDEVVARELERILIARRDAILERWLTRLSPLTWPEVRMHADRPTEVCLQDLAVWSGIREAYARRYRASAWHGDALEPLPIARPRAEDGSWVCVGLPEVPAASRRHPPYLVVDLVAESLGHEEAGPARLHFYALSDTEVRLVGLERPVASEAPAP